MLKYPLGTLNLNLSPIKWPFGQKFVEQKMKK